MQHYSNSFVNALELLQSCTTWSISWWYQPYKYFHFNTYIDYALTFKHCKFCTYNILVCELQYVGTSCNIIQIAPMHLILTSYTVCLLSRLNLEWFLAFFLCFNMLQLIIIIISVDALLSIIVNATRNANLSSLWTIIHRQSLPHLHPHYILLYCRIKNAIMYFDWGYSHPPKTQIYL